MIKAKIRWQARNIALKQGNLSHISIYLFFCCHLSFKIYFDNMHGRTYVSNKMMKWGDNAYIEPIQKKISQST